MADLNESLILTDDHPDNLYRDGRGLLFMKNTNAYTVVHHEDFPQVFKDWESGKVAILKFRDEYGGPRWVRAADVNQVGFDTPESLEADVRYSRWRKEQNPLGF